MGFIAKIKGLPRGKQEELIVELLNNPGSQDQIEQSEGFISPATDTNAQPIHVDEVRVRKFDIRSNQVTGEATFEASGEQREDAPTHGTGLNGNLDFIIDDDEDVNIDNVSASIDFGQDEDDEPDIVVDDEE